MFRQSKHISHMGLSILNILHGPVQQQFSYKLMMTLILSANDNIQLMTISILSANDDLNIIS